MTTAELIGPCNKRCVGADYRQSIIEVDDFDDLIRNAAVIRADQIEKSTDKVDAFFWWGTVDLPHSGHKLRLHRTTQ